MSNEDLRWIESQKKFNENFIMRMTKPKASILTFLNDYKDQSISQIQRALKTSYKEAYRHVKELISWGWVSREKQTKQKHAPVYLNLTEEGKKAVDFLEFQIKVYEAKFLKKNKP